MRNPEAVKYWLKAAVAFDFIGRSEAPLIWQMLKSQDFSKFDDMGHTAKVIATLMIMDEILNASRIRLDLVPVYEEEGLYSYVIPETSQLICLRSYQEYIESKIAETL